MRVIVCEPSEFVGSPLLLVFLRRSELLVKDGLSLGFATTMFQTWVTEKGIGHVSSALRKAQLETRLLVSLLLMLQ